MLWPSTRSLGKPLNQPSIVSNFDFLGINSSVTYETNLSYVQVNKLQKYAKSILQKLSTLHSTSPNGLGFQVQKTDKSESRNFFCISLIGLFSPELP